MIRHGKLIRLRPEVLHFFDTNYLIRPESDLPSLKNVPLKSRWITETVRQEAMERLSGTAMDAIDRSFRTLTFSDLYEEDHRVCPVFYWFVLSMYNPATVGSASFLNDWFDSRLIKKAVTQEDREIYQKLRRQSGGRAAMKTGTATASNRLDHMATRLHKKARRSLQDKHPSYIRDIKSLSLALYHSLSSRQNAVYHTTDGDPAILLLKWLDSMTMWITLGKNVLSRLAAIDRQTIMGGGRVNMVLDFAEFAREKSKVLHSMLSDRRKTNACRFTIKHWNQLERRLDEDVYLVFEEEIAGWLANLHGPLSCGGTANAEVGNWLGLRYHWPPDGAHLGKLRVQAYRKSVVRSQPMAITASEHDRRCRYRQDDFNGRIQEWSQFI
jgi:hypothetical protein